MAKKISSQLDNYVRSASESGLSGKASSVYVALLDAGVAMSPKSIITKTSLHRQYVYDAIHELLARRLIHSMGCGRTIKYIATSPDKIIQDAEIQRIKTIDSVQNLMKLYNKSPAGLVEVISGSSAVIESEFKLLEEANENDFLDIIGGGGMHFVKLFEGRIDDWEQIRKEKNIKLRYIGPGEDVVHNRNVSVIKNESKMIKNIENIVSVSIRPKTVSFNIYEPEIMTVRVHSESAVISQRALFEVLWKIAI